MMWCMDGAEAHKSIRCHSMVVYEYDIIGMQLPGLG